MLRTNRSNSEDGSSKSHRTVIVGGGFGGLHVAQSLRRTLGQVTLIDRRNYHLFQPLLYQVATGTLSPANICAPLRAVLRRRKNVEVVLGEVVDFDVDNRQVLLRDGRVSYDTLVIAAGARYNYFGNDDWQPLAPSLKSIEDATEIRRRVLVAFEAAERESDRHLRRAWLTFVIVGAGPTGVEMAGALAEIARYSVRHDFRHIDPAEARIILVEGLDRVLGSYPPDLSDKTVRSLRRLGVTVRTGCMVTEVQPDRVRLGCRDGTQAIQARTILWTAGVQASPLAQRLAAVTAAEMDRGGRIAVEPDLTVPGHPEIFVIGDMARFDHQTGEPLPGMAPVAIQQGRYVARLIRRRLSGKTLPPFRYRDRGNMATIGRSAAVADLKWCRLSGFPAWVVWLFVHLMQLVMFQNRVLVLVQWAWHYITFNKSARLITGETPILRPAEPVRAGK
jgi:NADH dehydrogenase